MKYEKQISKAIKRISKESGLSYGQIAIKLGISKSGVNNWVWRNQMPIDSMLKVCEVFDMEITDFLKPEEGKKKIDRVFSGDPVMRARRAEEQLRTWKQDYRTML